MTDLSELGRRMANQPPFPPTPRPELERRWRRRHARRWGAAALLTVVVGASVAAGLIASQGGRRIRVVSPGPPAFPAGASVVPSRPEAMAVGPGGNLYVADPGRNQILEFLPGGHFVVVAGTGRRGALGDGGPALDASLSDPSGMAFSSSGTLYFADQGNRRVRAVSTDGTIDTVAGGGTEGSAGFVAAGTPAGQASFSPADVAFGPGGRLYIATGEQVLRLEANRTLTVVAGSPAAHQGLDGVGGPATAGSADGANGIAFDSAGNLYISGFNTKSLIMVTPGGTLTLPPGIGGIYPRGDGGLATMPDGSVVAMDTQRVLTVTPTGPGGNASFQISFESGTFDGISGFSPNGIAVGRDGTVYLDTYKGNGYADRSAISAITPQYSTRLLWQTFATRLPPSPRRGVVLRGSGVADVAFGTAQATAIGRLNRVLGTSTTTGPEAGPVGCGVDSTARWSALVAYFYRGSFVGYSTVASNGSNPGNRPLGTTEGLRVDDPLSRAEQIYGSAFTTSFAQGGSWSVSTPTGTLDGYLSTEPNLTPPARIASIEAGTVGCPGLTP
ncbi:MAG TPA: hypothetical protein VFH70_02625 [Acidimicrobiales bacterium]|nr:hypothetical protein [Acidimicrobiales bacterium]